MENKIEIFQSIDSQTEIKVQFDEETVWLTQKQMAELYGTSIPNINMHLKNIFEEGELDESSTIKDFLIVQREGKRDIKRKQTFYNLDTIISIGYRIKSNVATKFRQWATQRLKDYLVQGYAINEALAALTLFIATSKTEEVDAVKNLVISILNIEKGE